MTMSRSIILFSDGDLEMTKKLQKQIKNKFNLIQYILVPVDDSIDSYILLKPNRFMAQFAKAHVSFETVIEHKSYIDENSSNHFDVLNTIDRDLDDLTRLIQYLHSLNRIRYVNKLSNSNESAVYEITEFTKFMIDVYDTNDNIIFKKHLSLTSEKGHFGAIEILEKISSLYHPIQYSDIDENLNFLHINSNSWEFKCKAKSSDGVYGYMLPYTKSITFFDKTSIEMISNIIFSTYVYTITYDKKDSEYIDDIAYPFSSLPFEEVQSLKDTCPVRFQDLWCNEIEYFIEYITYLEYIYTQIGFISEMNDFGKYTESYVSETTIDITSYIGTSIHHFTVECSTNKVISIKHILNLISDL